MRVHSRTHTDMVENGNLLPYTTGKAMVAQASFHSIHLSPVCEREIEWQDDMDCS